MIIQPSEFPGSHERHLLRRYRNPLFSGNADSNADPVELNDDTMLDAQRLDHEELIVFMKEFRALLQESTSLADNVDSDTVLKLKDRLDRAYERASAVADDQAQSRDALRKLVAVLMGAVRHGAGNDSQAHEELDQEDAAREAHFKLLESQLVADLLNTESVIGEDELLPSLLSAPKEELALAVQLFDPQQLQVLVMSGIDLLDKLKAEADAGDAQTLQDLARAEESLVFIQGYIEFISGNLG